MAYEKPSVTCLGGFATATRAFNKIGSGADVYSKENIPIVGSIVPVQ